MAFSLKNKLKEFGAQVNVFDGGKTAATVRAARPAPAPVPTVTRRPEAPNTGNIASRVYDQLNVFDNNRTFKQREATQNKSNFQQLGQVGAQTVRTTVPATIRAVNTIDAQRRQLNATGRQFLATATKNPDAYRNAMADYEKATDRFGKRGGIMDVGTFYNADEARRGDLKTGIKRIGGGIAESALEVGSLYAGGGAGKQVATQGAKAGLIKAAPTIAKNIALNAGQGAVSAYNQDATGGQIIKNAAVSAGLGTVGDIGMGVGGALVPKVARATTGLVKQQASTGILNPSVVADALTPKYAGLKKNQIIMDPAKLNALNEARDVLSTMYAPGMKPTTQQAQRVADGLRQIYDENGLEFINGNNAERVQRITQYLEKNGEAIPKFQKSLAGQEGGYVQVPGRSKSDAPDLPAPKTSKAQAPLKVGQNRAVSSDLSVAPTKTGGTTPYAKDEYVALALPEKAPTRTEFPDENKLNTGRLNIDDTQRKALADETIEVVDRLSNKEIEEAAKGAGLDFKSYGIEGTKKRIAEQLNVRKDVVRLMNETKLAREAGDLGRAEKLILEASEKGRISKAQGSDVARQLQARRIIANELDTPEMRIYKLLDSAGVSPETYAKKLAPLDLDGSGVKALQEQAIAAKNAGDRQEFIRLTDMADDLAKKNSNEIVKVYREMVPGKAREWLDTVRYNSMLSSPLTQATNVFGNAQNVALIAPIEKTLRGAVDAVGSAVSGRERKYAATEGGAYAKGVVTNLKNATTNFGDAMRGVGKYSNADLRDDFNIPLAKGGVKGGAYSALSAPMRVLDGMDKFFRTLAEGGEEAALTAREKAGIKVRGNRTALKEADAAYRVYQTPLGESGQGVINEAFDAFAGLAMKARNSKNPVASTVAKFTIPFVKTVNNINKQGIVDYSPLGFVNLKGNADKTTAITRAIMGSAVFGTSAALLQTGDMTWAEPRDPDERARFRAEGKQPYSIKIGDKWVGFSKVTPTVAFPMAMTAAIDDAIKNKKLDDSDRDSILEAVAKYGNFLSDQSYAKSVGDTLAAIGGDKEAVASAASNNIQQLVPARALTGWFARIGDDKERKVDTSQSYWNQQVESLMQQYPGLREKTATRDYKGEPIAANNQVFNGFSPVRVTKDRGVDPVDAEKDRLKAGDVASVKLDKGQTAELSKITGPEIRREQEKLINSPEYKTLTPDEKQSAMAKVSKDITAARKAEYMTANGIEGSAKLTGDQKNIVGGKVAGASTKKTYADKYDTAVKTYEREKSKMSRLDQQDAEKNIASLKIKKDYDDDIISLYGRGKGEAYKFLNTDENGKAMADKLIAYGDALVDAGLATTNKFRDKYGKVDIRPKETSKGTGKTGRGVTDFSLFTGALASGSVNKSLRSILESSRLKSRKA